MCDTPVLLCSLLGVRVRILQRSSQENQKLALTERLASSLSPRLRARGFAEAASTATVCNGCQNDAVFPYLAASLRFYAALRLGLTLPRCCSFRLLLQARVRHSQHRAAWLCSPAACPARRRNALDTDTLKPQPVGQRVRPIPAWWLSLRFASCGSGLFSFSQPLDRISEACIRGDTVSTSRF